jgi:hypothetical protein
VKLARRRAPFQRLEAVFDLSKQHVREVEQRRCSCLRLGRFAHNGRSPA